MRSKKRLFTSILVAFFLVSCLSIFSAALSATTSSEESNILFEVEDPGVIRGSKNKVTVPVIIANTHKDELPIELRKIELFTERGEKVKEWTINHNLPNISQEEEGVTALKQILREPTEKKISETLLPEKINTIEGKIWTDILTVDLEKNTELAPLEIGDTLTYKLVSEFVVSGESTQYEETFSVAIDPPLAVLPGWYPGDAHIHTAFSDSAFTSVGEGAEQTRKSVWPLMAKLIELKKV